MSSIRILLKRCLLALAAAAWACSSGPAPPPNATPSAFDLEEATIADLQTRMESGAETSRSLVQKYLDRIDAIDRQGPALHAVIEVNPGALADADRLDAERKAGRTRGPLHGIPILVKDNFATADRMQTTAGSLSLAGMPVGKDAFVITRLREAGVVLLGKSNLSEWANFRDRHSSSGWSGRGGQTKNPYALDRSPSGSSSGSGAAIAANLAAVALGTETDGSIVSPASVQALVGIKPTHGLLSRTGIVPISGSQDTPGPMARTVADAALLLGAMVGADPADPDTAESATRGRRDYAAVLDAAGLTGARVGVVRGRLFGYSPAADRLAETAIADLRKLGAVIVDPADITTLGSFEADEMQVLLYEFNPAVKAYFSWVGASSPMRSLENVIAFDDTHRAQELPFFGHDLMTSAVMMGPLSSDDYRRRHARYRQRAARGIDEVMEKHRLDALIAPTGSPAWLIDLVNGDRFPGDENAPSTVTSVAGYPQITVPMGEVAGLPVGLSFFGRAWSEPTLIKLAYAYEQATRHRRPPAFASTARVP